VVDWVEAQYPGLIENFSLASLPRVVTGQIVVKLNAMTWHALDLKDGLYPLLCSDRPCVFTEGIDHPDCIVALPLSPRHAFLAFNPKSQAQAALTQHGPTTIAKALNKNVISQAKDRAYCFNKTDAPEDFFEKCLVSQGAPRAWGLSPQLLKFEKRRLLTGCAIRPVTSQGERPPNKEPP
jgi:hypothetical protein